MLKLDATAEMDEFSKYLNEFEDEVLVDKKKEVCTLYSVKKNYSGHKLNIWP